MRVEVTQYVFAPVDVVWDVLTDWERQAAWMVDARSVEVVTAHREGEGVRIEVPTDILGFTVTDVMVATAWRPHERLAVEHVGWLIRGTAAFDLAPTAVGTRVTWWEEIDPPLGPLGEAAANLLVRPYVNWMFGRSLRAFKTLCEREARRTRVREAP